MSRRAVRAGWSAQRGLGAEHVHGQLAEVAVQVAQNSLVIIAAGGGVVRSDDMIRSALSA